LNAHRGKKTENKLQQESSLSLTNPCDASERSVTFR